MLTERHDGSRDFDFLLGHWHVHNRQLRHRLQGSDEWREFDATQSVQLILGGLGNLDEMETDLQGTRFIGLSLRLYNPETKLWSIYWVDNRSAELQPPVVGSFRDGVGLFSGADICNGQPVIARFIWSEITDNSARWEQAFSPDAGQTWETNWIMTFQRRPA